MRSRLIVSIGKTLILCGVYFMLLLPLLEDQLQLEENIPKLHGAFTSPPDTAFNWDAWFDRAYQDQKEEFIKANFGFHNDCIQLITQLEFTLFRKTNVTYMVVGKQNYLYEVDYINAYYGRDFLGTKKIETLLEKLKCVQDTLVKRNKLFFLVYAAGKASYYPEYIPSEYRSEAKTSNYAYFTSVSKKLALNHIDFNDYFMKQKSRSKYPLYPQYGIHWSNYGSMMALDSMVRYIEYKTKLNLPDMQLQSIEFSDSLRSPDNDALLSISHLIKPKTFKMAYPEWVVKYDSTKHKKLKLLVVADSFWWYMYSTGIPASVFSDISFWYYNKEIYPESFEKQLLVTQSDYFSRIADADVILIMHTEATLRKFEDGFVDMCYRTYCVPNEREQKLQKIKKSIRYTEEWYSQVQQKAREKNISVDSMMTLDAIYVLDQAGK